MLQCSPPSQNKFVDETCEDQSVYEDDEAGEGGEHHGPVDEPRASQPVVGHVLLHPAARQTAIAHHTGDGLDDLQVLFMGKKSIPFSRI